MKRQSAFANIMCFIIACTPLVFLALPVVIVMSIVERCKERKRLKAENKKAKELPVEEYKHYGVDL